MTAPDLGVKEFQIAHPEDPVWRRLKIMDNGCWEYQGARDRRGYGSLHRNGVSWRAHRFVFQMAVAPIPAEMVVMHICDNPPCCNPAHLRLGTVADNNRDRHMKGRTVVPPVTPRVSQPHGTRGRYRAGCRCDPCRDSENVRQRERSASRRRQRGLPPFARQKDSPHGTRSRYRSGCRCDPCRKAESARKYVTWRG